MRNVVFAGIIIIITTQLAIAQINAVTENGEEVFLYEDGTWQYANDSLIEKSEITVNPKPFVKDKQSTFLVKSNKLNIGIWINPKIWSFAKGSVNDAFEYNFQKKGDDLYAMLITEKMLIPVESLKKIAIDNARKVAPDIKVNKEEYRTVNGISVFMMQMSGTIQGMRVTYYGYYYSNANGTIQFLTYTGENLFKNYLPDIELFLNGFVEY